MAVATFDCLSGTIHTLHPSVDRQLLYQNSYRSVAKICSPVTRGGNPAFGLERFREAKRERFLSREELKRLILFAMLV
jgi:hypothetical protein